MESTPFILGNKPYGVTTLALDSSTPGYIDWLSEHINSELFVCHQLDKEITGAQIFATTPTAAAQLTSAFTSGGAQMEYLFITDKKPRISYWILKNIHFESVSESHGVFIVRAKTKTGSSQNIRSAASESGVTPQFLHCASIEIPEYGITHRVALPAIFTQTEWLKKPMLVAWHRSVDRRRRLYDDIDTSAYRWIHDEGTPLRLDVLGSVGCAGWWREEPPSDFEMSLLEDFFSFEKIKEWRLMHYSGNRLQDKPIKDTIVKSAWTGTEKNLKLEFRKESGLSCGLFLDQRNNRQWVQSQSKNKTILNLFAYTGAFSVAAALGGATKVTTVDLSKNYIEWSKTNFGLNELPIESHGFYAMDSMEYLKYAHKKQMTFDLIICDPPSFSRDKKGNIFRVEKDFEVLLSAACKVLSPNGAILFSTNYEKWTAERWGSELEKALAAEHLEITEKFSFAWDFETHLDRHMKAFLLIKK